MPKNRVSLTDEALNPIGVSTIAGERAIHVAVKENTGGGVQSSWYHGMKSGVGTTAVKLNATSISASRGVLIKAADANSGTVYIGNSSAVTAGTVDSTSGFELNGGASHFIECTNVNLIWLIANAPNQKVFWEVW